MTEKLKVSREVADAIEKTVTEGSDFRTVIERHIGVLDCENVDYALGYEPLETLNVEQLATALIVGYEVRVTPHEVIANEHRRTVKEAIDGRAGRFELTELGIEKRKSFVEGIEFILDTLNIKIKGVNDNDNNS